MTDTLAPSDVLYYSIKNQKGWAGPLDEAQSYGPSPLRSQVGRIVSTILIATDEGGTAVAVGGEIDDDGKGYVAVITSAGIVHVETARISAEDTRYTASIYSFDDVSEVSIAAKHSYFDGTDVRPRHKGMSFSVTVGGKVATFTPSLSNPTPMTDSDAILKAFRTVQAGR